MFEIKYVVQNKEGTHHDLEDGLMDQYVERGSEINFDKGAVPSGKKVSTSTSESFDGMIN